MIKEKLLLSRLWKARQNSIVWTKMMTPASANYKGTVSITAEQAKAYKDYHAKQKQVKLLQIKAFTMLESLLVLGLVSVLALGLSGSVQSSFAAVEEQIFFMEFEELYRETQKRSVASQQKDQSELRWTDDQQWQSKLDRS